MSLGVALVSGQRAEWVLLLALLGSTLATAQGASVAQGPRQVRRIELRPAPLLATPEVAIRPGTASLFLFDSPIARDGVELEGRERFGRVAVGEDTLALLPLEGLREGERLRLTVRFADGTAPTEARFLLVVREQAEAQVEVLRARTLPEAARLEPAWMVEELQRLREENSRLRAERGPGGLAGILTGPWIQKRGIAATGLNEVAPQLGGKEQQGGSTRCIRAETRVAVELTMTLLPGEPPWSPGSAVLRDAEGRRLRIVQVVRSAPGAKSGHETRVIVEAEASASEAHGPHTLELQEANGERTLTLGPLTFPELL